MPYPGAALTLAACMLILSTTACGGQSRMSEPMNASSTPADEPVPLRTLNPNPVHAYEIRVLIDDPPGPFASISGVAQYDVQNPGCGDIDPFIGAIPPIRSNEVIELRKVSDREYAGVIYSDRILDEDYYGNGVCHWKLVEARIILRGDASPESTRFVADLPAEAIESQGEQRRYFWKGYYPRARMDGYVELGGTDLDKLKSRVTDDQKDEFFSVVMTARGRGS